MGEIIIVSFKVFFLIAAVLGGIWLLFDLEGEPKKWTKIHDWKITRYPNYDGEVVSVFTETESFSKHTIYGYEDKKFFLIEERFDHRGKE